MRRDALPCPMASDDPYEVLYAAARVVGGRRSTAGPAGHVKASRASPGTVQPSLQWEHLYGPDRAGWVWAADIVHVKHHPTTCSFPTAAAA